MTKRSDKSKVGKVSRSKKQKGRQQGSQTTREAAKSNSAEFYRHPGQGMRGAEGGRREEEGNPGQRTKTSDSRKHVRPEQER